MLTVLPIALQVPFYQLRRVLPDPALLRVARQVRNESLKPYKKATEEFWRSHTICIELKRDRWARAVTFNQGTLIKAECTKILRCKYIEMPISIALTKHISLRCYDHAFSTFLDVRYVLTV